MKQDKFEVPREIQSRLEQVSADDFALFLVEKNVGRLFCPICRSRDMSVPQVEAFGYAVCNRPPVGGITSDLRYSYIEFICIDPSKPDSIYSYQYRIICKNCGFTSHYAVHPVLEWFEDSDKKQRED